jgi:hypothetical protein
VSDKTRRSPTNVDRATPRELRHSAKIAWIIQSPPNFTSDEGIPGSPIRENLPPVVVSKLMYTPFVCAARKSTMTQNDFGRPVRGVSNLTSTHSSGPRLSLLLFVLAATDLG